MAKKQKQKTLSLSSKSLKAAGGFAAIAIAYAEEAAADERGRKFGKWLRLAAKRFLKDLDRAADGGAGFTFSAAKANEACEFIENLPHVEGVWETPNIRLHPSHIFFVVQLFGFRSANGTRRYTSALFAVARKNAKSTLAGAILLVCLCLEDEPGPQVISAATTGSQARIVFNVAKRMVEKTPALRDVFMLEAYANAIARLDVGGTCKPINAKASTQDGLNPSVCALDEIHAHKTHDLLNVLRSAAGARRSPLFLYTTTEGYENPGPWSEIRSFAQQLLQELVEGDHFLAVYYAVDDEDKAAERSADDDFDESTWIKANPLIEVNPFLLAEIRKEAIEAKSMPGRLAEFRIKRLNRRAASAESWINLLKWNQCAGKVSLKALEGELCYAGLDLASTTDMSAWRMVWYVDGHYYTAGRFWLPEEALKDQKNRGKANYSNWTSSGLLTITSGSTRDADRILNEILEDCQRFSPRKVAFDPWNAVDIAAKLLAEGVPMEQFIQGARSYNPAMQLFETAYIAGNLSHGGDPILTWNAANLVARRDVNMNLAPDRKNSAGKIDGMAALLMAFGMAAVDTNEGDEDGFYLKPAVA